MPYLQTPLELINQILNAGNAITAFSLLLYSLTFNVRERAARAMALLLGCVAVVYSADVMAGTTQLASEAELWLRLQWLGISFTPAAYLWVSDALLAATGRPSRGRRNILVRLAFVLGGLAFLGVGTSNLIVQEISQGQIVAYMLPGSLFPLFATLYLLIFGFAGWNFWRAYRRCLTRASRRRMVYLLVGSLAPFLGTFPFLTTGANFLVRYPLIPLISLAMINASVTWLMVMMAYAVAYFGVGIPDRIVKGRIFQWILRGPFVASTVLAVSVSVNRLSQLFGFENSRLVPLSTVATLLLLQLLITFLRPSIERWIFYGPDRQDITRLHFLEERLLTTSDLRQFLEALLNATCDITGAPSAFLAVVGEEGLEFEVAVGTDDPLRGADELPPLLMTDDRHALEGVGNVFQWADYWLLPLHSAESKELVGLMGISAEVEIERMSSETVDDLRGLSERAAVALTNRLLQREIFSVVDRLVPEVEVIQRIRAAARYAGSTAFNIDEQAIGTESDLFQLVRSALGHYWGGPRLTESPLLRLRVVRNAMAVQDGNPVNALRDILKRAIERTKPDGERRFTAEWMLYNILELKFLQGRKVRDVAARLAMSEADLYRKQKVAIEAVAQAIAEMERSAIENRNAE